ncbi:MAG: hypothetical protein JWP01_2268 [Myxococcales bacterium]|nr:hypothetical protein [Myxococcales bacterium]
MKYLVVAAALLSGCRGDHRRAPREDAAIAVAPSMVPALPRSPDSAQELRALDLEIERARIALPAGDPAPLITGLARRAAIRGRLDDFTDVDQQSKAWAERAPSEPAAWRSRIAVLIQLHRFAEARAALASLVPLTRDRSEWESLAATLDEASGQPERAVAYRERAATVEASAVTITALAANLADRGELTEAIALIPRAAAALRDPSPVLVSWLLVQWGQLHTRNGAPAAARELFAEAHARMPGYVEASVQLAHAIRATGGDPRAVATEALADGPHPELLAIAGTPDAAAALWDRYTTAHRAAFADHAARFYLAGATASGAEPSGVGARVAKAIALATDNFANRPTLDARALLVEAQLAGTPSEACSLVDPLLASTRAHQFLAWRALTACGRTTDAARVATTLGIR